MVPMLEVKREYRDSGFKIIFSDATLLSQFLNDYIPVEILKKVKPEHIKDVSTRFVSLVSEDQEGDSISEIEIPSWGKFYAISLLEHESRVNQRMGFKILQYMVHIWTQYEADCEERRRGSTKLAGFRYPPIIPIVYYDGDSEWRVPSFRDRVWGGEEIAKYTPDFAYEIMSLRDHTVAEIAEKRNALVAALLVDKARTPTDISKLAEEYSEQFKAIDAETPEHVKKKLADFVTVFLTKLNIPADKITEITSTIHQKGVAEMFAMLKPFDYQKILQEGRLEGRQEGRQEKLLEVATNMKRKGYEVSDIIELTGLTLAEVEQIKKE
jgi:predicted transposase/invertase (TIGR01784 family)